MAWRKEAEIIYERLFELQVVLPDEIRLSEFRDRKSAVPYTRDGVKCWLVNQEWRRVPSHVVWKGNEARLGRVFFGDLAGTFVQEFHRAQDLK